MMMKENDGFEKTINWFIRSTNIIILCNHWIHSESGNKKTGIIIDKQQKQ